MFRIDSYNLIDIHSYHNSYYKEETLNIKSRVVLEKKGINCLQSFYSWDKNEIKLFFEILFPFHVFWRTEKLEFIVLMSSWYSLLSFVPCVVGIQKKMVKPKVWWTGIQPLLLPSSWLVWILPSLVMLPGISDASFSSRTPSTPLLLWRLELVYPVKLFDSNQ